MKLKLPRSKTEKNYESNTFMMNLSNNKYKNLKCKEFAKIKNLKLKSLSNFDEEYLQRLKYKLLETNLNKNNKNQLLLNSMKFSPQNQIITQNFISNMKLAPRKSIFLYLNHLNENKMRSSKYESKAENIYKENSLENKRIEIENKMNKIKRLMKPLSIELTTILKKIDNYKIDLEIIKNFKFSESNIRKRYLSQRKTIKSDETSNLSSENANNTEKLKQKDLENLIKMEKVRLHKKKLDIIKKMESLDLKKNNILIKYESCEKDLKDLKTELFSVKGELTRHYHKLLLEGKDTRNEGLSWIIRAIWKLRMNVLMSYLPNFLDEKSIDFLFKYSDKLVEIEEIQKTIKQKKDYLKKFGRKIEKLSEKLLHYGDIKEAKNEHENEKNNNTNNNIFNSPKKRRKSMVFTTPTLALFQNAKRNNNNHEDTPMSSLKRLLSTKLLTEKIEKDTIKEKDDNNQEKTISKFDEETFKTSLYNTKNGFKSNKQNNNIFHNLEMMLSNPNYLDQLTSHLSTDQKLKISDFRNIENFTIEDIYDTNLVKIFNEHKGLLLKLKEKKKQAEKFVRKELDRIGKCFCLEDYSGKFNTDLKTVIGALIGEDNAKLEVFRQQKEQKDYFKTIKNIRSYNLLNKKIY